MKRMGQCNTLLAFLWDSKLQSLEAFLESWLGFGLGFVDLNITSVSRNQASILLLKGRNLDGLGGWSSRQSKEGELLCWLGFPFFDDKNIGGVVSGGDIDLGRPRRMCHGQLLFLSYKRKVGKHVLNDGVLQFWHKSKL